jgi:hypothetical protein
MLGACQVITVAYDNDVLFTLYFLDFFCLEVVAGGESIMTA